MGQHYEIGYENGIKVLNSSNVNYSFGSLHKVMQKGLTEILKLHQPENVLMLGLGAGSAIDILYRKCTPFPVITAIEYDADIIRIARDEFDVMRFPGLQLRESDAFEWLQSNTAQFDLLIDDIFVDDLIPEACFTVEYLKHICNALSKDGVYFRNMMKLGNKEKTAYERILRSCFKKVEGYPVKPYDNRIYICCEKI